MNAIDILLLLYKIAAVLLCVVYIWFYNKFKWKISQDVWLIYISFSPLAFTVTQFCYLFLTGVEFYKNLNLWLFYLQYTWYFTQMVIYFLPTYMLYKYCPSGKIKLIEFIILSCLMVIIVDIGNFKSKVQLLILLIIALCNINAFMKANLCLNTSKIKP